MESVTKWDPFKDWNPFRELNESQNRQGSFFAKARLPEVEKENGILTIRGERKFQKEEKGKRYHRCERSYGSFTRSFSLPEGADSSSVRAEFRNGLVQVHMPKSEKARKKLPQSRMNHRLQQHGPATQLLA